MRKLHSCQLLMRRLHGVLARSAFDGVGEPVYNISETAANSALWQGTFEEITDMLYGGGPWT